MLDEVLSAVPDFVYLFDLEGRFIYANPALHKLLQRAPGQMAGLNFHELGYPPALATTLQAQIQEVIDSKAPVRADTEFESAFGVGHYEYIFVPVFREEGVVAAVAGTTRDVSESKRVERALRKTQQELRAEREMLQSFFEQAPAFIATLVGPEFVFQYANEHYFNLIGGRDVIGRTVREAFPEVEGQGYIELLQQVYASGEAFVGRGVSLVFSEPGREPRQLYIDFIYQAIKDPAGNVTGILAHGTEVTEQILAKREIERLNEELEARVHERTLQLEVANRELEGFTYSVSHDLRAPLRAIVSSSRILLDDFGDQLTPAAAAELRRQAAAANRMAVLIDDLLRLSRLARQDLHRVPLDLSAIAFDVAEVLARHGQTRCCVFQIQPGMTAHGDATSLRLLLLNIMQNACKFSPNGGSIDVGGTASARGSIFWVKDQGIGLDMRYAEKIFLPFERLVLDQDFPGTGIGLANAKRIVERHGGELWVESAPGKGATFFFTLAGGSDDGLPRRSITG